jgi:protein-disulfide isomerase
VAALNVDKSVVQSRWFFHPILVPGKRGETLSNNKMGLVIGAAILAIGIPGLLYSSRSATVTPIPEAASVLPQQDDLSRQRTKGSPDAPMTLYEFADFQCPACRVLFEETIPDLVEEYVETGKLKIIFLNFPIPQIHPNAPASHEFAMCAARQDKFWAVHDLLYSNQNSWDDLPDPTAYFTLLADSAGLQADSLSACVANGLTRSLIQGEFNAARQAGIQSTPSLVLEGGLLVGAVPMEVLRPILDSIYEVRMENQ